jgi:hypothetical protein
MQVSDRPSAFKLYRKINRAVNNASLSEVERWRTVADLYHEIQVVRFQEAESKGYFRSEMPAHIAMWCLGPLFGEAEALLYLYDAEKDEKVLSDCMALLARAKEVCPRDFFSEALAHLTLEALKRSPPKTRTNEG